jgi:hypothetical protein
LYVSWTWRLPVLDLIGDEGSFDGEPFDGRAGKTL